MKLTTQFTIRTNPISLNHAYPSNKQGRRFLTKEGKEYKELIGWEATMAGAFYTPPIEVKLIFYFKDNRKRDVDNFIKLVLDSLSGIIYKDDSDVTAIYARKAVDKNNPRISITIRKLKELHPDGEIEFDKN